MNSYLAVSNPDAQTDLIIVMGVAGSGKSTLCKELANIYGYQFLDGDDFHSERARSLMAEGIALTDAERTPWVESIKKKLEESAKSNMHTTLAFSGLKQIHRNVLRSAGLRTIILFLDGDKETIQTRINNRTGHFMAPTLLDSQFKTMEDPRNETDVHRVSAAPKLEQVVAQAKSIVEKTLLSR